MTYFGSFFVKNSTVFVIFYIFAAEFNLIDERET